MNFHNRYHLGDNIYSLIFLNNIIDNNDVDITHSCAFDGVLRMLNYKNIKINNAMSPNSIDTWIQANNVWGKYCTNRASDYIYYDEFYLKFYSDLANRNNLKHTFNNIEDTLFYHPDLENRRYSDYDFLIMNSRGLSGQYSYNHENFYNFANKLKLKGFKIITTEKIVGFDSTLEKNMSLLDIANLAIGCKYVIGVHTAPYATALNKKSINTVKKWIVLNDKNINYKIKDDFLYYENILDVKIEEIEWII